MSDYIKLNFLPYIKREFPVPAENTTNPGHISASFPLKILNANNMDTGTQITINAAFRGPGDILGFNSSIISRLEPTNDSQDFEPNYFPFVEFVDPDFLWRYSLDVDDDDDKIDPWLSLIALTHEELKETNEKNGIKAIELTKEGMEILNVSADKLPDLKNSWTSAHLQLIKNSGDAAAQNTAEFIKQNPSKNCCRLFCFRKLEPKTAYAAFIVPNYKIGVEAFLGVQLTNVNDKAWASPTSEIQPEMIKLPIYYRWSFMTSEKGDFEELARNLKPIEIDSETSSIGKKAVDASKIDNPDGVNMHPYFFREGALTVPGFQRKSYSAEMRGYFFTEELLDAMNESLASESITNTEDKDPLISYPVYGRYFRKIDDISYPGEISSGGNWTGDSPWIHELNLDFRSRLAGGLATTVVQNNQDDYMRECWYQVGEIRKANERLRLAKSGLGISDAIDRKHLKPLSDERFTLISRPFHSHLILNESEESISIKQALHQSGIPRGVTSAAFKKISRRSVGINNLDIFLAWKKAKINGRLWNQWRWFILKFLEKLSGILRDTLLRLDRNKFSGRILEIIVRILLFITKIVSLNSIRRPRGEQRIGALAKRSWV